MSRYGELKFKTLVFDLLNHGSIKVEVRATYDVEMDGYKYLINDLTIDSVFADEHIDPNVNIINEIGKENLELIKDQAETKLQDEISGYGDSDLYLNDINDHYEDYE